jgi:hypothetical protein
MSVQIPDVIPAKAGIQVVLLDSDQNHAGMTDSTTDTSLCGAVLGTSFAPELGGMGVRIEGAEDGLRQMEAARSARGQRLLSSAGTVTGGS